MYRKKHEQEEELRYKQISQCNNRSNSYLAILLCLLTVIAGGCKQRNNENISHKLTIVATTGMIRDALQNIAGDSAEIFGLMGPGVDPHLYKASFGDLRKLRKADVIVHNGLHLEGKMNDVFEKISRQKKVITLAKGLSVEKLKKSSQFGGNYDPHIWFNVSLWKETIEYAGAQLMLADTLHAIFYKNNLDIYLRKLDSLDKWVKFEISTIPKNKRVLVTAHDAFGYFGEAYDIEVRGLQGISTLADFGLNDISSLVNLLVKRKIKAVFVESSVPRKSIDAVVEGCNSQGHHVNIGGTLFSDALGKAGTPEGNYIGMVKYNVHAIVHALR